MRCKNFSFFFSKKAFIKVHYTGNQKPKLYLHWTFNCCAMVLQCSVPIMLQEKLGLYMCFFFWPIFRIIDYCSIISCCCCCCFFLVGFFFFFLAAQFRRLQSSILMCLILFQNIFSLSCSFVNKFGIKKKELFFDKFYFLTSKINEHYSADQRRS